MRQLSQLDLIVVIAYLLLIFIAGMWLTRPGRASLDHPLVLVADYGLGLALRNWLLALALLFGFNFSIGWLLLR